MIRGKRPPRNNALAVFKKLIQEPVFIQTETNNIKIILILNTEPAALPYFLVIHLI